METYFRELSRSLIAGLGDNELLLMNYEGESSDFARFNHCRIRQAGHVRQSRLKLEYIHQQRQCQGACDLSGDRAQDLELARSLLGRLKEQSRLLPQDPYINYADEVHNSVYYGQQRLPDLEQVMGCIVGEGADLDLVGIWASGAVHRGFANSLGQFNWHTDYSFNFDWSVYHQGDKAVKQSYAGEFWQEEVFRQKLATARETLPLLAKPAKVIAPGQYRVYLTPTALCELLDLLNWGGFGLKSHRTAQTPLIKMIKEGVTLDSRVTLTENHKAGFEPGFSRAGFVLPDRVSLVAAGEYQQCLADQRSAKEYGEAVNCDGERAQSLEMAAGDLARDDILTALGTGAYISNLWYCNYSDRNHCRITGMTRFACLWVEKGVPVAPLAVMRFDESLLQVLGGRLQALSAERERLMDTSSYGQRSHSSWLLPGALLDGFEFTL